MGLYRWIILMCVFVWTDRLEGKKGSTDCTHSGFIHNVNLEGGKLSNNYTLIKNAHNMIDCVEKCCQKNKCDLAMFKGKKCFSVNCDHEKSCRIVHTKTSTKYGATIAFITKPSSDAIESHQSKKVHSKHKKANHKKNRLKTKYVKAHFTDQNGSNKDYSNVKNKDQLISPETANMNISFNIKNNKPVLDKSNRNKKETKPNTNKNEQNTTSLNNNNNIATTVSKTNNESVNLNNQLNGTDQSSYQSLIYNTNQLPLNQVYQTPVNQVGSPVTTSFQDAINLPTSYNSEPRKGAFQSDAQHLSEKPVYLEQYGKGLGSNQTAFQKMSVSLNNEPTPYNVNPVQSVVIKPMTNQNQQLPIYSGYNTIEQSSVSNTLPKLNFSNQSYVSTSSSNISLSKPTENQVNVNTTKDSFVTEIAAELGSGEDDDIASGDDEEIASGADVSISTDGTIIARIEDKNSSARIGDRNFTASHFERYPVNITGNPSLNYTSVSSQQNKLIQETNVIKDVDRFNDQVSPSKYYSSSESNSAIMSNVTKPVTSSFNGGVNNTKNVNNAYYGDIGSVAQDQQNLSLTTNAYGITNDTSYYSQLQSIDQSATSSNFNQASNDYEAAISKEFKLTNDSLPFYGIAQSNIKNSNIKSNFKNNDINNQSDTNPYDSANPLNFQDNNKRETYFSTVNSSMETINPQKSLYSSEVDKIKREGFYGFHSNESVSEFPNYMNPYPINMSVNEPMNDKNVGQIKTELSGPTGYSENENKESYSTEESSFTTSSNFSQEDPAYTEGWGSINNQPNRLASPLNDDSSFDHFTGFNKNFTTSNDYDNSSQSHQTAKTVYTSYNKSVNSDSDTPPQIHFKSSGYEWNENSDDPYGTFNNYSVSYHSKKPNASKLEKLKSKHQNNKFKWGNKKMRTKEKSVSVQGDNEEDDNSDEDQKDDNKLLIEQHDNKNVASKNQAHQTDQSNLDYEEEAEENSDITYQIIKKKNRKHKRKGEKYLPLKTASKTTNLSKTDNSVIEIRGELESGSGISESGSGSGMTGKEEEEEEEMEIKSELLKIKTAFQVKSKPKIRGHKDSPVLVIAEELESGSGSGSGDDFEDDETTSLYQDIVNKTQSEGKQGQNITQNKQITGSIQDTSTDQSDVTNTMLDLPYHQELEDDVSMEIYRKQDSKQQSSFVSKDKKYAAYKSPNMVQNSQALNSLLSNAYEGNHANLNNVSQNNPVSSYQSVRNNKTVLNKWDNQYNNRSDQSSNSNFYLTEGTMLPKIPDINIQTVANNVINKDYLFRQQQAVHAASSIQDEKDKSSIRYEFSGNDEDDGHNEDNDDNDKTEFEPKLENILNATSEYAQQQNLSNTNVTKPSQPYVSQLSPSQQYAYYQLWNQQQQYTNTSKDDSQTNSTNQQLQAQQKTLDTYGQVKPTFRPAQVIQPVKWSKSVMTLKPNYQQTESDNEEESGIIEDASGSTEYTSGSIEDTFGSTEDIESGSASNEIAGKGELASRRSTIPWKKANKNQTFVNNSSQSKPTIMQKNPKRKNLQTDKKPPKKSFLPVHNLSEVTVNMAEGNHEQATSIKTPRPFSNLFQFNTKHHQHGKQPIMLGEDGTPEVPIGRLIMSNHPRHANKVHFKGHIHRRKLKNEKSIRPMFINTGIKANTMLGQMLTGGDDLNKFSSRDDMEPLPYVNPELKNFAGQMAMMDFQGHNEFHGNRNQRPRSPSQTNVLYDYAQADNTNLEPKQTENIAYDKKGPEGLISSLTKPSNEEYPWEDNQPKENYFPAKREKEQQQFTPGQMTQNSFYQEPDMVQATPSGVEISSQNENIAPQTDAALNNAQTPFSSAGHYTVNADNNADNLKPLNGINGNTNGFGEKTGFESIASDGKSVIDELRKDPGFESMASSVQDIPQSNLLTPQDTYAQRHVVASVNGIDLKDDTRLHTPFAQHHIDTHFDTRDMTGLNNYESFHHFQNIAYPHLNMHRTRASKRTHTMKRGRSRPALTMIRSRSQPEIMISGKKKDKLANPESLTESYKKDEKLEKGIMSAKKYFMRENIENDLKINITDSQDDESRVTEDFITEKNQTEQPKNPSSTVNVTNTENYNQTVALSLQKNLSVDSIKSQEEVIPFKTKLAKDTESQVVSLKNNSSDKNITYNKATEDNPTEINYNNSTSSDKAPPSVPDGKPSDKDGSNGSHIPWKASGNTIKPLPQDKNSKNNSKSRPESKENKSTNSSNSFVNAKVGETYNWKELSMIDSEMEQKPDSIKKHTEPGMEFSLEKSLRNHKSSKLSRADNTMRKLSQELRKSTKGKTSAPDHKFFHALKEVLVNRLHSLNEGKLSAANGLEIPYSFFSELRMGDSVSKKHSKHQKNPAKPKIHHKYEIKQSKVVKDNPNTDARLLLANKEKLKKKKERRKSKNRYKKSKKKKKAGVLAQSTVDYNPSNKNSNKATHQKEKKHKKRPILHYEQSKKRKPSVESDDFQLDKMSESDLEADDELQISTKKSPTQDDYGHGHPMDGHRFGNVDYESSHKMANHDISPNVGHYGMHDDVQDNHANDEKWANIDPDGPDLKYEGNIGQKQPNQENLPPQNPPTTQQNQQPQSQNLLPARFQHDHSLEKEKQIKEKLNAFNLLANSLTTKLNELSSNKGIKSVADGNIQSFNGYQKKLNSVKQARQEFIERYVNDKKHSSCNRGLTVRGATLRGGILSGEFQSMGVVDTQKSCIDLCCKSKRGCDIAMTIGRECINIKCFNKKVCTIAPAGNLGVYNNVLPVVTFMRRQQTISKRTTIPNPFSVVEAIQEVDNSELNELKTMIHKFVYETL